MARIVDETVIQEAADCLLKAAPGSTIILFGSWARGDSKPDSDADFLVIEPEVNARRDEMVRLLDVLRPLRIPVDVVVASVDVFNKWSTIPGTIYHEAKQQGRVLHATQ
ncbi:MAG TPA: nucleotidyltransferase domain-containing protein [Candidatus Hydrogenedentes bacterium]|nr:nucleotidyltransferase domain-containing protein [Candidatus Hydrogenedentota bacterium]